MPEPNSLGKPWKPSLSGILDVREMYRGRSGSANIDGTPTYQRTYLVRTTVVNPNIKSSVALAPGPRWRDPYPGDPDARLIESSVTQDGDSPFHYKVTHTYRFLDENDKIPWHRPSQYSFSGTLASAPAFWHYSGGDGDNQQREIIINSAGDPISGLDRDEGEFNVTIQYNQKPPFDYPKAQIYVGAINSDLWSGGLPKTWKVQSISATRKIEVIPGEQPTDPPVRVFFFDTTVTIAYRASRWDLETWDVGFNELRNGKRVKVMAGSSPVSEPVALAGGVAKAPGQPPDSIVFRIYPMLPFAGTFEPIPNQPPPNVYPYNL
jgi:hypothetical protein